ERPGRPLPSGRIAVGTAFWLGVGFFAGGLLFAALADLQSGLWLSSPIAACLIVAILLYDGAFKNTWLAPFVMGICRALNVLLGLTAAGHFPPAWGVALAGVVGLYILGVTLFARTEAKESDPGTLTLAAGLI